MKRRQCTAQQRAPQPRRILKSPQAAVTPLREYTPAEVAAMTPEQLAACQEEAAQQYIQMLRHGWGVDADMAEKLEELRKHDDT